MGTSFRAFLRLPEVPLYQLDMKLTLMRHINGIILAFAYVSGMVATKTNRKKFMKTFVRSFRIIVLAMSVATENFKLSFRKNF